MNDNEQLTISTLRAWLDQVEAEHGDLPFYCLATPEDNAFDEDKMNLATDIIIREARPESKWYEGYPKRVVVSLGVS